MTDEMIIKNAYEVIQACANFSNSTLNFCNSVSGILSAMDRGALQTASMTGSGLPGYGGNKGALNPLRYSGVSQCARSVTKLHNLATALTPIVSTGFSNLTGYDQDIVDQILGKKSSNNSSNFDYVKAGLDTVGGLAATASIFSDMTNVGHEIDAVSKLGKMYSDYGKKVGNVGTAVGGIVDAASDIKQGNVAGAIWAGGYTVTSLAVEDAGPGLAPYYKVGRKWIEDFVDPDMDTERKIKEAVGEAIVVAGVTMISVAAVAALAPIIAPAMAGGTAALYAISAVSSAIYLVGDLMTGDLVETLSDGLISMGEKVGESVNNFAKDVGNAVQSGWNTFCSWFS